MFHIGRDTGEHNMLADIHIMDVGDGSPPQA